MKINPKINLILADVDETIADVYTDAAPEMVIALSQILEKGKFLFLISGGGYQSIFERVISKIRPELRRKVLLAHCSGAEVVGFDLKGDRQEPPYYSLYDQTMTVEQKEKWRELMQEIISKFKLKTHTPMPVKAFQANIGTDILSIMYADRGPQITLEFVNAYKIDRDAANELSLPTNSAQEFYDLRDFILPFAREKISEYQLPIEVDYGGMFAMDFKLHGVSKTTSVKYILNNKHILNEIGLNENSIDLPEELEIWGDKFSAKNGGSDRYMCEAVDPKVRAIDFRIEDPSEFTPGYNIVLWDGKNHLHEGTLEYIQESLRS